LPFDDSFLKKVCVITSVTTDFASVVNKIKEGPKQRGSTRISYRLSDGSTRDVYPIILKALALDPSQLNHPYQQLNDRIKGVQWLARTKAGQSADQRKEEVSKLFAKMEAGDLRHDQKCIKHPFYHWQPETQIATQVFYRMSQPLWSFLT